MMKPSGRRVKREGLHSRYLVANETLKCWAAYSVVAFGDPRKRTLKSQRCQHKSVKTVPPSPPASSGRITTAAWECVLRVRH